MKHQHKFMALLAGSLFTAFTLGRRRKKGGDEMFQSTNMTRLTVPPNPATPLRIAARTLFCTAILLSSLTAAQAAEHVGFGQYPVPSYGSGPWGITPGPDGALWFTENDGSYGNRIGRINTAGVVTEYAIPTPNSYPSLITNGPDGALWFGEIGANSIGRITTSGAITEYPLVSAVAEPEGIAAGPDGALWFAEYGVNKIGRITTTGTVTEFSGLSANAGPQGISAGPDGALWFTDLFIGKIGRITTAGVVTEYPVPTPGSKPESIVTGPDGALWFTEYGANKIGRITTSGVFTEYAISTSNFQPYGIAAGPDGKLWFTSDSNSGDIGSITTAGAIKTYHVPGGSGVFIAPGPDGALWFTEFNSNKIGQALLTTATLSVSPGKGPVGTTLTFTGSSFAPNEAVRIYTAGVGSPLLVSGAADSSGSFTATVAGPASVNGYRGFLAAGHHSGKLGAVPFKVQASLALDPDAGPVGSLVSASGYGFAAGEPIQLHWKGEIRILGTASPDGTGTFSAQFTVPSGFAPGAYTVIAEGTGLAYPEAAATFTLQ